MPRVGQLGLFVEACACLQVVARAASPGARVREGGAAARRRGEAEPCRPTRRRPPARAAGLGRPPPRGRRRRRRCRLVRRRRSRRRRRRAAARRRPRRSRRRCRRATPRSRSTRRGGTQRGACRPLGSGGLPVATCSVILYIQRAVRGCRALGGITVGILRPIVDVCKLAGSGEPALMEASVVGGRVFGRSEGDCLRSGVQACACGGTTLSRCHPPY